MPVGPTLGNVQQGQAAMVGKVPPRPACPSYHVPQPSTKGKGKGKSYAQVVKDGPASSQPGPLDDVQSMLASVQANIQLARLMDGGPGLINQLQDVFASLQAEIVDQEPPPPELSPFAIAQKLQWKVKRVTRQVVTWKAQIHETRAKLKGLSKAYKAKTSQLTHLHAEWEQLGPVSIDALSPLRSESEPESDEDPEDAAMESDAPG